MHFGEIKNYDIANGIGVRVTMFVSGCRNHCKGCFQPETWSFDYGTPFSKEIEDKVIEDLKPSYINGLSILGGEPFEPENQRDLLLFIKRVRKEVPDATIWMYSGYTWEQLNDPKNKRCHCDKTEEILENIDILVDGRFEEAQKDITLSFRGSRNQRVIDVKESIGTGHVVLSEYNK